MKINSILNIKGIYIFTCILLCFSTSIKAQIKPGAERLEEYLDFLKGKRIAMVVNPTSIIGNQSSVDSLLALGVNIVKVFGPEHGFRGM